MYVCELIVYTNWSEFSTFSDVLNSNIYVYMSVPEVVQQLIELCTCGMHSVLQ